MIDDYRDPCIFVKQEKKEVLGMRDKHGEILLIGNRVRNNNGMIGRLINFGGKSYVEHNGGKVLLSEVDLNQIEKVS